MDLWPASGPAGGQTWDLIYPLFAPISSAPFSSFHAFVLANALSLISVESTAFPLEGWWRIISRRCPDSTFLHTFFRTPDTFYWKHVKKKKRKQELETLTFFPLSQRLQCKLTWASIHQAVTRQINTHFHVSHLDLRRLTFSPKLMLARLETITLHSSVHMRWFTGLVHRCHWINNSRSLQTDLAWLTIHGGVYSSVIVCLQVSQVWARKRWGGGEEFTFLLFTWSEDDSRVWWGKKRWRTAGLKNEVFLYLWAVKTGEATLEMTANKLRCAFMLLQGNQSKTSKITLTVLLFGTWKSIFFFFLFSCLSCFNLYKVRLRVCSACIFL